MPKHNVKDRLFQKNGEVVSWDLVIISEYTLETGLQNKVSVHHLYQEYSKDNEIQDLIEIDLVSNYQFVAIAAETSSIDTVWFMYVIDIKCVHHSCNNIGNYSDNVPKSQWYLLCNYLKKLNNNKRGAVSNPLDEFKPDYNKKKICIFLVTIDLLKFWIVFNLLQWFYYFSHFCFSYLSKIVPRSHLYLVVFLEWFIWKILQFPIFFQIVSKFAQSSCLFSPLCSRFHLS